MSYINYLSAFPVTEGWASHLARGSLGGIDYGTPVGTPLRAPSVCKIQNIPNNGTGGNTVTMYFADGTRDQYMHLSRFVAEGGYQQGAIVGYSGGAVGSAGAGASTGPHCHWHKILANGTRVNPLNYLTATAGLPTSPFPADKKRNADMPALIKRTEGTAEWSLVWPPFDGGDDLQKGYVATTDPERAKWWARFYELGQGTEDTFNRDDYVAAQKFARLDHAAWLKGQPAGVGGSTDLAPVLTAVAGVSEQVAAVPSAEQNGAAARTAIIK